MINTQEEYKSALDFIDRELELYDFELPEKMNSYVYNIYLQDIEYYLDFLYEKYRTIEDLCDYLEKYANVKIDKVMQDILQNQSRLETSLDKHTDKKYRTYNLTWDKNNNTIYDRDGSVLSLANINYNNALSPARTYGNAININGAEKTNYSHQAYSDNMLSCIKDRQYIVSYQLDQPSTIKEKIKLDIDHALFKYIDLMPVNCEINIEDKNEPVITLTANSMKKVKEKFDQNAYNRSAMNKLNNVDSGFSQSENLQDNYEKILEDNNQVAKNEYLRQVDDYLYGQTSAGTESALASERVNEWTTLQQR